MSVDALTGLGLGAVIALGLILLVAGWKGHKVGPSDTFAKKSRDTWRRVRVRGALALAVGAAFALATRWPVAAVSAAAVVWLWPKLFGGAKAGERGLERVEALAIWTESLRDTIAGAIGLQQAIPATLDAAPPTLQAPLTRLVAMLQARIPLTEALARFGDDLDDPSADLVVAALILNSRLQGPGLEATLSELAKHAREELDLRRKIEASRKALRRDAKLIVYLTAAAVIGLVVFGGDFVAPYYTTAGQVVLAIAVAIFVGSGVLIRKASEYAVPDRFLIGVDELHRVAVVLR